jgi:hypothetical protein
MRRGVAAVVVVSVGLGACSLIVDASGLSGGAASLADASATDASLPDAGDDTTSAVADAASDAPFDVVQDAGSDAGFAPAEGCSASGDAGGLVYPGDPCNLDPSGQPIPALGACKPGKWACVDLGGGQRTATCIGAVGPKSEVCTGPNTTPADENCNGTVDEGCTCALGAKRPCGVGQCSVGAVQNCVAGDGGAALWGPCVGPAPKMRDCMSNVDNDCNGTPDNAEAFCKCAGPGPALQPIGASIQCSSFGSINACASRKRTCVVSADRSGAAWDVLCQPGVVTKCGSEDQDCSGAADKGERPCKQCRDAMGAQVVPLQAFSSNLAGCGGSLKYDNRADLCAPGCDVADKGDWKGVVVVPKAHYWLDDEKQRYFSRTAAQGCAIGRAGLVIPGYTACAAATDARVCAPSLPNNKDSFGNACSPTCAEAGYLGGCGVGVSEGAGTICRCP